MENIPLEMILNRLDKVGLEVTEGVKTGIKFVYPLAIKEVIVNGIMSLLLAFIVSFIVYKSYTFARSNDLVYTNHFGEKVDDSHWLYSLSIIGSVVNFFIYKFAISRLVNPDWHAIQKLIEMLTDKGGC